MFDVDCIGPEHVDCEQDSLYFAELPQLNNVLHKISHWIDELVRWQSPRGEENIQRG